mmetsp:Transcript_9166/g.22774  ORF Transcript_9166/g.22774 Transcript_9166/m.22774 type:complete len:119 (+) Transcript_9166:105-461(+)
MFALPCYQIHHTFTSATVELLVRISKNTLVSFSPSTANCIIKQPVADTVQTGTLHISESSHISSYAFRPEISPSENPLMTPNLQGLAQISDQKSFRQQSSPVEITHCSQSSPIVHIDL